MFKLLVLSISLLVTVPAMAAPVLNSHELSIKLGQSNTEAWLEPNFRREIEAQLELITLAYARPEAITLWRNLQRHPNNSVVYADATVYLIALRNSIANSNYSQQLRLELKHQQLTLQQQQFSELIRALHNDTLFDLIAELPPQHRWYKEYRRAIAQLRNNSAAGFNITAAVWPSNATDIKNFQRLHGLTADGVIGEKTQYWLEYSAFDRARILARNSQRLYAFSQHNKRDSIVINITNFELNYYRHGELLLSSRVIVGETEKQTPVLNSQIEKVVRRPNWNVPYQLMRRDLFPKIIANPNYLQDNGFVVRTSDRSYLAPVASVADFDWSAEAINSFPYLLQQQPGPKNALGKVKFLFPNKHSVYLHATNAQYLFAMDERTFSSGCIRVEKSAQLSQLLLAEDQPINDSIEDMAQFVAAELAGNKSELAVNQAALMAATEPEVFHVSRATAVNIYYLTAWPDELNKIQYRKDIYRYDIINQVQQRQLVGVFAANPSTELASVTTP